MVRGILFSFFLLFLGAIPVWGQPFGNEWITPGQTYYKIPVAEDGLYRLTYTDLAAAGFPVNTVDPRRVQLFHRGQEHALNIVGQVDARWDPEDYLEFFGLKNDGSQDTELYITPDAQPHPYYSLFSDTTAYFLTWRLDATPGKRIETFFENNVDNLPAEAFHRATSRQIYRGTYSAGRQYPLGVASADSYLSDFDHGEGWTGGSFGRGQSQTRTFTNITNLASGGEAPSLYLILQGRNNLTHNVRVEVGPSEASFRELTTATWNYRDVTRLTLPLLPSDISADGQLIVRVTVLASGRSDFVSFSLAEIRFPQEWDAENKPEHQFGWETEAISRSYAEIANVPDGARFFDLTVPLQVSEIGYNRTVDKVSMVYSPSAAVMDVRMVTEAKTPPIVPITLPDFAADADYLMITHPFLRQPHGVYSDPVQAFADYRGSAAGGGYRVALANVTDLYNIFSYGEISPLAIRRFLAYQLSRGNPQYLFLVGKSRYWFDNIHRLTEQPNDFPGWFPAMGFPGSDMAYSFGLGPDPDAPAYATGRLNAVSSTGVAHYLDKVKELELETFENPWRKKLLHLSGGATENELRSFPLYVQEFAKIAESDFLGGDVEIFSKTSDAESEIINVSEIVNEGVGVLLMFGHSAARRTDIDIGFVSDPVFQYNNRGRYPLLFVNGCNAGNIFADVLTFGEDWIFEEGLGASTVIAHSATGFSFDLRRYSRTFYEVGFADPSFFGASIGQVMNETIRRYRINNSPLSEREIAQAQQMVLQGDPAIKLFGPTLPDVKIPAEGLQVIPYPGQNLSSQADSLRLEILVENIGVTSTDTLFLSVTRTLPSGTTLLLDTIPFPVPKNLDTLYYNLPNDIEGVAGTNQLRVSLDPGSRLAELSDINNTGNVDFFLPAGNHINLLPADYAVVSSTQITLLAQTNDVLGAIRPMDFQLDTNANFNSPYLQTTTVSEGSIKAWSVSIQNTDSTTYYWRTRFTNPLPEEGDAWQERSFTYTQTSTNGWAQVHPQQWSQNRITGLTLNEFTGVWDFQTTQLPVTVKTYGDAVPGVDRTDIQVTIQGLPFIFPLGDGLDNLRFCRDHSFNAIAFDRQTSAPYVAIPDPPGSNEIPTLTSCGRRPQVINNLLQSDIIGPNKRLNEYINGVKDGDWVVFFSIGTLDFAAWPADVLLALEEVGVPTADLVALAPGEAFVFVGQKVANPNTIWEKVVATDSIELAADVIGQFTEGSVRTNLLGPAAAWEQLIIPDVPQEPSDKLLFDVYGKKNDGTDTLLLQDLGQGATDISFIDATRFPVLEMVSKWQDEVNFSPAQLREWWVVFQAPPEGVLLPTGPINTQELQEGEELSVPFQFVNVSNESFGDSLVVNYSIVNQETRQLRDSNQKILAPAPGDTTQFLYSGTTIGLAGNNSLNIGVNNEQQEPELTYLNNTLKIGQVSHISRDSLHPLLDVTVDGRYLLDGELVSPSPRIVIRMRDENQLLRKTDTVGIQLLFKAPCEGCDLERIAFTDPRVVWTPASSDQDFRVEFQPQDLSDGQYALRVQVSDATGNDSGEEPYQINFRVVNEASVTRFYPYPNPFSTACRFVFTLTGATVPDEIKIQVMTVTGKVVREITQEELGPIHIGNNLTEFAWDGTDTWGQKLANGVYLYRVTVKSAGESVDLNAHATDERAFTRNVGKLYILR